MIPMATADLPFPKSLPGFQRLFPDDAACATYVERLRWREGFACPHCNRAGEPYRFANRPGVLRCRGCQRDISLTAGTVMQDTRTPLTTWFWGAYLVASMTPGMSAKQFARQLEIKRYETAFQLLHKLRAAMVRPDADRIGGTGQHVEVDETWVGGTTRGQGRGVHDQTLVIGAVEARRRKPPGESKAVLRRGGLYAGRLRLAVVPNRTAEALTGFVAASVSPTTVVTDGWSGYGGLKLKNFEHIPASERGDAKVSEEYLPLIHLVFANLKAWLTGIHHGRVAPQHLQAYLNEFVFRFNRRFYPFSAFKSLLGLAATQEAPTYDALYSHEWAHPTPRA